MLLIIRHVRRDLGGDPGAGADLHPIAVQYGIDPVHFGLIISWSTWRWAYSPAARRQSVRRLCGGQLSIDQLIPGCCALLVVLACLMAITYMPWISLGLVDLLY
ncbi:hypothetical protein DSL92_02160 [Billgrantia gudaonensis]|uniref:Uncharacterized protein n=1 Tax=Billgrantia gudaonensis TaxID=376427 RepID=A0A3S0QS46_9GAMM|nr:hypothetical protein DSL92_02160 [Halomonas gudaonensis]